MTCKNVKPMLLYVENKNFIKSDFIEEQSFRKSESELSICSINNSFTIHANGENEFELQDGVGILVNDVQMEVVNDREHNIDQINDKDTLHKAIVPLLLLAKYFGLFPVHGIRGKNTSYLFFKWFSSSTIYLFILLSYSVLGCFIVVLHAYSHWKGLKNFIAAMEIDLLTSYLSLVLHYILFVQLARKWPNFMKNWERIDRETRHLKYHPNTALKVKQIIGVTMSLYTVVYVHAAFGGIKDNTLKLPIMIQLQDFLTKNLKNGPFLISIGVCLIVALIIFVTFITISVSSIRDMFIIILACALSDKFKQLNQRMANVKGKVLPSSFWQEARETYNHLSSMTKELDDLLSPVILLSFTSNLIIICGGFMINSNTKDSYEFLYGLLFFIGITYAVILYTASVNEQSKELKDVLYAVPSKGYGVEVSRFLTQVTTEDLALTGWKLFSVTRTFQLRFVGCLVSYAMYRFGADSKHNKNDKYFLNNTSISNVSNFG